MSEMNFWDAREIRRILEKEKTKGLGFKGLGFTAKKSFSITYYSEGQLHFDLLKYFNWNLDKSLDNSGILALNNKWTTVMDVVHISFLHSWIGCLKASPVEVVACDRIRNLKTKNTIII